MSSFKLILHLMMGLLSISNASSTHESCRAVPATTIYVDKSGGSGHYSTVQEAVDSVPDHNNQWIRILIKTGTYSEKAKIPRAKQYIFLQGESRETTTIRYGDAGSKEAATFQVYADNFVASGITFENSYINRTNITWNLAALIKRDKASFRRCGFRGIQDTLGDFKGRHYFESCFISGAFDFIYGQGQSVYKTIASNFGWVGHVTAQGREGANDPSAFVFKSCRVTGEGRTYLGRAGWQYSRVLFYKTYMSNVVVPEGWESWNGTSHEDDITYAEVGGRGKGANKSGRMKWMEDLPPQELEYFLSNRFMNQES